MSLSSESLVEFVLSKFQTAEGVLELEEGVKFATGIPRNFIDFSSVDKATGENRKIT